MTHSYAYINKSTALGKARELLTTSGGAPKPEPELWVHVASATSRDQLYPCGSWRYSVQIHISLASELRGLLLGAAHLRGNVADVLGLDVKCAHMHQVQNAYIR